MAVKSRKPLNKYSIKKIEQINSEFPIRLELIKRAKGIPQIRIQNFRHSNGKVYQIKRVVCINGLCECNCGKRGNLEPHEKLTRGRGGKLSLENSLMVLRECHRRLQNREPKLQWLKRVEA